MEQKETKSQSQAQKILVIDDEDDYRTMIAATLTFAGYDISQATNGLDGLAAIKLDRPDLVLCDINMPKMDGYTLLDTLKEDPTCASVPFIFLTGDSTKNDIRHGMQLGADDYLTKPFTSDELISAIETRLARKKSLQKYYESQFDDIKTSIVMSLPHEFRTPLHAILGYAQILQEEKDIPSGETKEIGSMIHKSARRLHHLLENLILLGELQFLMNDRKAVDTIRREAMTSIREVIRSAAEHEAGLQKRTDAIDLRVNDTVVQISSTHLTKIIEEITGNALKFSEPGTKITILSEDNDAEVLIIIKDEGRGMSRDQIAKITSFQQFERHHYEQQGAGLGLVIAKTLAALYNGSLAIDSTEKAGTTVTIKLLKAANP